MTVFLSWQEALQTIRMRGEDLTLDQYLDIPKLQRHRVIQKVFLNNRRKPDDVRENFVKKIILPLNKRKIEEKDIEKMKRIKIKWKDLVRLRYTPDKIMIAEEIMKRSDTFKYNNAIVIKIYEEPLSAIATCESVRQACDNPNYVSLYENWNRIKYKEKIENLDPDTIYENLSIKQILPWNILKN